MTVRSTAGAQGARLKRTLLAAGGGVALSFVIYLLFIRGSTRLSAAELWSLMAVFWVVNLGFVLAVLSGLNLRLNEPSMTLAQMIWATLSTFILAYFVNEGRHLLLMIYLLTMTFGSFRLNTAQHLVVAVTALIGYAIVIVSSAHRYPEAMDGQTELLNWTVFFLVLIGLSLLGGETSRLRMALVRRNRELSEAHEAKAIAFEAKSRFLASSSHELRTPLNSILGATDIVDGAALDSDQRDALTRARYAGKHLLYLINTMIDLSRSDSGILQLRTQQMDLCAELDSLLAIMQPEAALRSVELTLDRDPQLPTAVMGDALRLQEVMLHLVKFAITTAPVRQVCIRVRNSTHQHVVNFSICSSATVTAQMTPGAGAQSREDPLFESFRLDLCQKLVALMGGTLSISGLPAEEVRFEFELGMPQVQVPSVGPDAPAQRRKLLIVDDAIDNRLLLQAYLKDEPWDLRFAEDGVVAITEARQQAFDLILMDMHMPRMNGIEATQLIRKIEHEQPGRSPARIFALTADDSVNDRRRSIDAGCDEHLTKPVSKNVLLQVLASVKP